MKRAGNKRRWDADRKHWERQRRIRLACMTAEARATYHRIQRLREEIGPLDFDIIEALNEPPAVRELRRIVGGFEAPDPPRIEWTST